MDEVTTIAWDGTTLTADSQAYANFKSRTQKIHRLPDGALFGAAGDVQEISAVLEWLRGGEKPESLESFEAMLVGPAGAAYLGYRLMRRSIAEPFFAVGSGSQFAIAAMACGKTAIEAVRLAARFDSATGGRVQSMRLRS